MAPLNARSCTYGRCAHTARESIKGLTLGPEVLKLGLLGFLGPRFNMEVNGNGFSFSNSKKHVVMDFFRFLCTGLIFDALKDGKVFRTGTHPEMAENDIWPKRPNFRTSRLFPRILA